MLCTVAYGWIKKTDLSPLFTCALPLLVLVGVFYTLIKETTKKKKNGGIN
ncbi:hypothetical protein ACFS6H_15965 [Terrimonas rubra]|uniref:Uncharacterized protein n=1 Tax=Terrimonas rubra TaxID=1035890 RepID=A0ABW6A8Z0_9BACT